MDYNPNIFYPNKIHYKLKVRGRGGGGGGVRKLEGARG